MAYIVSSGALNSTHSLTPVKNLTPSFAPATSISYKTDAFPPELDMGPFLLTQSNPKIAGIKASS